MDTPRAREIDACLRDGGIVITASDRAARALRLAYHRARESEGRTAWPAPRILDWRSFVREAWKERSLDERLLLNSLQEEHLWVEIAARGGQPATLLDGPRHRVAALAMEAHALLAAYAPRYLQANHRISWQQDAAAFSEWLRIFDETCRDGKLLSPARLPLELMALLREQDGAARPPLLIAGFDRIQPAQRGFLDAWGAWGVASQGDRASAIHYYQAPERQSELEACALWCRKQLAADAQTRLLVVTQDAVKRRGEIERAFLRRIGSIGEPRFEFSLGIPLASVPLARSAHLALRWMTGTIDESEIDWLFSGGFIAANAPEQAALQRTMRELRRRGRQQTNWTLEAFCRQEITKRLVPFAWMQRVAKARNSLAEASSRARGALDWAALIPRWLETAAWPGYPLLDSNGFQALQRWQQAVETCGSLGFDGRRMSWSDFLGFLGRTLDDTLFAPESRDAPIQIVGPAESAGLSADAIWFSGADEQSWPARAAAHPLLPLVAQRESSMPHAAPQLDWELAHTITTRLLASASEVWFSYARQSDLSEARPSRVVLQCGAAVQPLPEELASPAPPRPLTIPFADSSRILFAPGPVMGGSLVLTSQSQCPFKAFATVRLAAKGWEHAQAGLTPAQRGQLIHAVLHAIWAGPPDGIRTLDELRNLNDRDSFVAAHVRNVLSEKVPAGARQQMPRRYLDLEEQRLTRLLCEWLKYESTRKDFVVAHAELDRIIDVEGLSFNVRLDRVDRLNDGTHLVIDYKSGEVTPKSWDLPRPGDVQLPLYAGFALDQAAEPLGGFVFAKVRTGDGKLGFDGRVFAPESTLFTGLKNTSALAKNPLTVGDLEAWRSKIEELARNFVAGRAEVDPREFPKTCERCGLHVLCRIYEGRTIAESDESDEEAGDE
jgi:ATP-dependent helicase/nuclease subunit B